MCGAHSRELMKTTPFLALLSQYITAEDFAQTIAEYYRADPEQLLRLRTSARRFWEEHFDAKTNYRKFAEEVEEIEPRRG